MHAYEMQTLYDKIYKVSHYLIAKRYIRPDFNPMYLQQETTRNNYYFYSP